MSRELEQRVIGLERRLNDLAALMRDVLRRLAAVEQKALGAGLMFPPSSAGATPILWALATSGIAAATVTGTTPNFTLTPSSATCGIYSFDSGTNTFTYLGTGTVYNDWPNSGGSGVATGHWCQIYEDPDGNRRVLGEQC